MFDEPARRPTKWDWALQPLDRAKLSPQALRGLSFARTLANGLAGSTKDIARGLDYVSDRTIRRLIVRARHELRRELGHCLRTDCENPLPRQATRRRKYCSGACRVAALRMRRRTASDAMARRAG